jgi:deoxyhypusine synthase
MLLTLAGAMSTAELGLTLAEMIRQDKVHAISCTGANLEEDLFNLVAHDAYERVPHYRTLSIKEEEALLARHMNRVTDTCIPEAEAMRRLEKVVLEEWMRADAAGERYFPHEFYYRILRAGKLEEYYQIDPKHSWMIAAAEKNLPIVVPGWEDSTTGNMYASHVITGEVKNVHTVRSGIEYMVWLADYYTSLTAGTIGFFQIGGGIAGDFPICVVPMLHQDLQRENVPLWGLLLPDLGGDGELRRVLGRAAEREDHVGEAGRGDADVRDRERRVDRRAAGVRVRAESVGRAPGARDGSAELVAGSTRPLKAARPPDRTGRRAGIVASRSRGRGDRGQSGPMRRP